MYGTASSYNHKVISSQGATPIDYKTQDFVESILSITKEGVDVVFDPIGGSRQVLRSYKTLGKNGKLVWFGVAWAKKSGAIIIPFTLLMIFLLKCIPGGRKVLLPPDIAKDNT